MHMKVSEIKVKAFLSASSYITKRLIGCKFKRLDQAAYKSEVIVEAGMIDAVTPFYWESHLPRIMGAKSYGAEQVINEDLNRKHFHFKAVIGYWLRDAVHLGKLCISAHHAAQFEKMTALSLSW